MGCHGETMTKAETETALVSIIAHWQRHGFGRWAASVQFFLMDLFKMA